MFIVDISISKSHPNIALWLYQTAKAHVALPHSSRFSINCEYLVESQPPFNTLDTAKSTRWTTERHLVWMRCGWCSPYVCVPTSTVPRRIRFGFGNILFSFLFLFSSEENPNRKLILPQIFPFALMLGITENEFVKIIWLTCVAQAKRDSFTFAVNANITTSNVLLLQFSDIKMMVSFFCFWKLHGTKNVSQDNTRIKVDSLRTRCSSTMMCTHKTVKMTHSYFSEHAWQQHIGW